MFWSKKGQGAVPEVSQPANEPITGGADGLQITNAYWRSRYAGLLRVLLAQSLCLIAAIAIIGVLVVDRPEPRYFATDGHGTVKEIVPVGQPFLSNDALTQWAADTARMAYSLDFVNWRSQLSGMRDHFADSAYRDFMAEMQRSGNLALVRDQRVILEAVAEPGRIVRAGIGADGRYAWEVEVPLSVVTHYGGSGKRSQRLTVTLHVKRVDVRFRPESGVVVTQLLSRIG